GPGGPPALRSASLRGRALRRGWVKGSSLTHLPRASILWNCKGQKVDRVGGWDGAAPGPRGEPAGRAAAKDGGDGPALRSVRGAPDRAAAPVLRALLPGRPLPGRDQRPVRGQPAGGLRHPPPVPTDLGEDGAHLRAGGRPAG